MSSKSARSVSPSVVWDDLHTEELSEDLEGQQDQDPASLSPTPLLSENLMMHSKIHDALAYIVSGQLNEALALLLSITQDENFNLVGDETCCLLLHLHKALEKQDVFERIYNYIKIYRSDEDIVELMKDTDALIAQAVSAKQHDMIPRMICSDDTSSFEGTADATVLGALPAADVDAYIQGTQ